MGRTTEEKELFAKFLAGKFDGLVGDDFFTDGGSRIWMAIKNGKICRYKKGPGSKFFNGKENERIEGVLHILQEWITEEQVLAFFQKFGWLMNEHPDVQAYSAKFKPKR